ncbi:PREDICTED: uncharacterized protein LOC105578086 [Cercocebus atys]|uniref:uncharacterized protein LOC105578086 n=1 Tax=Cercocebus atys TaxID=9531 RepID=UPI0005F47098|nr:PREDICTED: uncharacterized protein LOC105578086 [Cercocebus atys]
MIKLERVTLLSSSANVALENPFTWAAKEEEERESLNWFPLPAFADSDDFTLCITGSMSQTYLHPEQWLQRILHIPGLKPEDEAITVGRTLLDLLSVENEDSEGSLRSGYQCDMRVPDVFKGDWTWAQRKGPWKAPGEASPLIDNQNHPCRVVPPFYWPWAASAVTSTLSPWGLLGQHTIPRTEEVAAVLNDQQDRSLVGVHMGEEESSCSPQRCRVHRGRRALASREEPPEDTRRKDLVSPMAGESVLTQPPSVSWATRPRLTISCTGSSSYIGTGYNVNCWQWLPGTDPKLLRRSDKNWASWASGQFSGSKSGNSASLATTGLWTEDETEYHCQFHGSSVSACSFSQSVRTQPPSLSASLEASARLTCTLSSGIGVGGKTVYWYQQKPGSNPRYLLSYYSESSKHQGSGVPGRFSGSKDASTNSGILHFSGCSLRMRLTIIVRYGMTALMLTQRSRPTGK